LSNDFFVPPGHFYSPYPDEADAKKHLDRINQRTSFNIPGVTLNNDAMLEMWNKLLPFMAKAPFKEEANQEHRYHWVNDFYSFGDASVYFSLISLLKPKKIIEIGSGFSSALALDTREHLRLDTKLTFIEPYPHILNQLLRDSDRNTATLIEDKVQNVSLDVFSALEPNDILFVDSSHVMKTGSDVCYEIFDILPVLKPGVIVHFHDVFFPFEYPEKWVLSDKRAWNELYALRAFLMYNSAFDILFFNHYFMKRFPDEANNPATPFAKNCGGGLWMVKK
jgi:predicted O-methyltransferase YrrM